MSDAGKRLIAAARSAQKLARSEALREVQDICEELELSTKPVGSSMADEQKARLLGLAERQKLNGGGD